MSFRKLSKITLCQRYFSSIPQTTTTEVTIPILNAVTRDKFGTKASLKYRSEGWVPGVIYGNKVPGTNTQYKKLINIKREVIEKELREKASSIENTLYDLIVDDMEKFSVIPRQLQLHPLQDHPIGLNFLKYHPGIVLQIPIRLMNEDDCEDIKRGSNVVIVNQFIDCTCEGAIPATLDVDMTHRKAGDRIRVEHLKFPEGVSPHKVKPDFLAAIVQPVSQ